MATNAIGKLGVAGGKQATARARLAVTARMLTKVRELEILRARKPGARPGNQSVRR